MRESPQYTRSLRAEAFMLEPGKTREFERAMAELQRALFIVKTEERYEPSFSYRWDLLERWLPGPVAEGRRLSRERALDRLIGRYLRGAVFSSPALLSRLFSVPRAEVDSAVARLVRRGRVVARGDRRAAGPLGGERRNDRGAVRVSSVDRGVLPRTCAGCCVPSTPSSGRGATAGWWAGRCAMRSSAGRRETSTWPCPREPSGWGARLPMASDGRSWCSTPSGACAASWAICRSTSPTSVGPTSARTSRGGTSR